MRLKRIRLFLRWVYRKNDYVCPGKRISPKFAWFVAKTVHPEPR